MTQRSAGEVLHLFWNIFLTVLDSAYKWFLPPAPKSVRDKLVLVTGAGSGIGRQLAYKLTQQGARLVLWDINKEGCDETANEVTSQGGFAKSYLCDVSNYSDVKNVGSQVRKDVGDVDILINNAGIMHCDSIFQRDEKKIRQTMDVNIMAPIWTVKEFLPKMYEKNEGHIVNVASMAAQAPISHITDYSASKAAVATFTEALGEELRFYKKTGVYTSAVFPVFVNTNLINQDHCRCDPGPDGFLEPDVVADTIVQGILRNKTKIYVPPRMAINGFIRMLLPTRVWHLMIDFTGAGFFYKTNKAE